MLINSFESEVVECLGRWVRVPRPTPGWSEASLTNRGALFRDLTVEVAGHGVVSHAGSAVLRLLADGTGLTGGLSKAPASARVLTRFTTGGRVFIDRHRAVLIARVTNPVVYPRWFQVVNATPRVLSETRLAAGITAGQRRDDSSF